jgi:hypothetical protein
MTEEQLVWYRELLVMLSGDITNEQGEITRFARGMQAAFKIALGALDDAVNS